MELITSFQIPTSVPKLVVSLPIFRPEQWVLLGRENTESDHSVYVCDNPDGKPVQTLPKSNALNAAPDYIIWR